MSKRYLINEWQTTGRFGVGCVLGTDDIGVWAKSVAEIKKQGVMLDRVVEHTDCVIYSYARSETAVYAMRDTAPAMRLPVSQMVKNKLKAKGVAIR